MKFSTKGRYALRMMIEFANHPKGQMVPLKEVSEKQEISLKYMEQIVTPLARAGLVRSERGSQGGYCLVKAPEDITAGEILCAIEGNLAPIPCLGEDNNPCPDACKCQTLPFWAGLEQVISQYAEGVTLADLVKQAEEIAQQ